MVMGYSELNRKTEVNVNFRLKCVVSLPVHRAVCYCKKVFKPFMQIGEKPHNANDFSFHRTTCLNLIVFGAPGCLLFTAIAHCLILLTQSDA